MCWSGVCSQQGCYRLTSQSWQLQLPRSNVKLISTPWRLPAARLSKAAGGIFHGIAGCFMALLVLMKDYRTSAGCRSSKNFLHSSMLQGAASPRQPEDCTLDSPFLISSASLNSSQRGSFPGSSSLSCALACRSCQPNSLLSTTSG